jgi:serine/threonine-protein kinase
MTGVKPNDIRSDLFFVGGMLYNMVTGVPPMSETKDRMQRSSTTRFTDIKPITDLEPDLPRVLVQFIQRAMEMNADKRFSSASEMLAEAKKVQEKLSTDPNATSEGMAALAAAALEAPVSEPKRTPKSTDSANEGGNKTVMIVESRMDMQDVLRDRLKKHGYRVLIFSDPERAVNRFEDGERVADCVVFCTPELGEAALRAFNRFGGLEETKDIPAILFVDQRQTSIIKAAELGPTRVLLSMPLKVKELREALVRLMQTASL